MKRRKFLIGLPLLGGAALLSYPVFRWMQWNTAPDLEYLSGSRALLASIVDTFLPRTDSPSASECGVHDFVIKMIRDCTDTISQNKFILGLKELEKFSQKTFSSPFQQCSSSEKKMILAHLAHDDRPWNGVVGKVEKKYLGSPFFATLKYHCVRGYCTSEGGATHALRYSHIPSHYVPCEPYSRGQRAWATT